MARKRMLTHTSQPWICARGRKSERARERERTSEQQTCIIRVSHVFDEKQRLTHISQPCAGEQKKVDSNESAIHWLERERKRARERKRKVYVHVYVHVQGSVHVYVNVYMCTCVRTCVHVCMCTYMCKCMHACMRACTVLPEPSWPCRRPPSFLWGESHLQPTYVPHTEKAATYAGDKPPVKIPH